MISRHNLNCSRINFPGYRCPRRIVVFESDDWGSIRMPSPQVYQLCLKAGYRVDTNFYERYDSLASAADLDMLLNSLAGHVDSKGHAALFTINCVVANPDFEKIRQHDYQQYFYQSLEDTFKTYPQHADNLSVWKDACEKKLFFPQSHGREHVNVSLWMNGLRNGNEHLRWSFAHNKVGYVGADGCNDYVESTCYSDQKDKEEKWEIIKDGLELFESTFGFRSQSFIPTNYILAPEYKQRLKSCGVDLMQGVGVMFEPQTNGKMIRHRRSHAQLHACGMLQLIRNCRFEPTLARNPDQEVQRCLTEIANAFFFKKPAIISTHRVNYVGFIDSSNRDRNLRYLNELLKAIRKRWPDVEFMNTVELGQTLIELNK